MPQTHRIHLVVAYFEDEDRARNALETLKDANKQEDLPLDGAALVYRDEEGKVHLRELGDAHAKEGALKGALIGGALGLLFGPLGVIGGGAIGAFYGSIAAEAVDGGVPDEALVQIASLLPNNASAVVALTTEEAARDVEALLASNGGQVVTDGGHPANVVVDVSEEDTTEEADADEPS
ncbi:MAG TPA: DUF1269 domain-containing protein [Anaerolineae bacterium]|nr:DUF1269 domain-containing protein [Anaerolineae bacterium]